MKKVNPADTKKKMDEQNKQRGGQRAEMKKCVNEDDGKEIQKCLDKSSQQAFTDCMKTAGDNTAKKKVCDDGRTEAKDRMRKHVAQDRIQAWAKWAAGAACAQKKTEECKRIMKIMQDKRVAMKGEVARTLGKDASKIKDSDISKIRREAMGEDAYKKQKECTMKLKSSTDPEATKALRKTCSKDVRDALEQSMGRTVTDLDVFSLAQAAKDKDVEEAMQTCLAREAMDVETSVDQDRLVCREELKDLLGGKDVKGRHVRKAVMDASKRGVREAARACKTRGTAGKQCIKDVTAKVKRITGKSPSNFDVRVLMTKAACDEAKDNFLACMQAKEDNSKEDNSAAASCNDPAEDMREMRVKSKPNDNKKQKINDMRAKNEIAKCLANDALQSCQQAESVTVCLKDAKGEQMIYMKELYGKDVDPKQIETKAKIAQRKSRKEFFGQLFHNCMLDKDAQELEDELRKEAHKDCMAETKNSAEKSGLPGKMAKSMVKKYHADLFKAIAECNGSPEELTACRQAATQAAEDAGVKPRAIALSKRRGELRAAVDAWGLCTAAGETNCEAQVKALFLEVSGADDGAWTDKLAAKVKAKATAFAEAADRGVGTEIRDMNQFIVFMKTNSPTCKEVSQQITSLEKEVSKLTLPIKMMGATGSSCRPQGDGSTEITTLVNAEDQSSTISDADVETISEALAKVATTAQEGSRRLRNLGAITVTASGADQSSEECPEDQADCGKVVIESHSSESPKASSSESPKSSSAWSTLTSLNLSFVVAAIATFW